MRSCLTTVGFASAPLVKFTTAVICCTASTFKSIGEENQDPTLPYDFRIRQQTTIIHVDPVVIWEISDQAAAVYQTYCVHSLVWARSPIVGYSPEPYMSRSKTERQWRRMIPADRQKACNAVAA
jgi:hypothetical protein